MTPDVEELATKLEEEGKAILSSFAGDEDMYDYLFKSAAALRSQAERIAGLLDQHARDSAELRCLCGERDEQKRKIKDLTDYIGICNQANERMQNAAYETGCPDETDVADWIMESNSSKWAAIQALQKALAYWMPSVFDERSGSDAYLLSSYQGETESECWGDKAKERIQALEAKCAELADHLKDMADEFVKVFPIYYYAEPWAHDRNVVLKRVREVIASQAGSKEGE